MKPGVHIVLRDGSTVEVREAVPEDEGELHRFLTALSPEAQAFRFFSHGGDLKSAARWAATATDRHAFGLVATAGAPSRIIAHTCFEPMGAEGAEVAFEVADAMRGKGLATILMAQLAAAAQRRGIRTFVAEVLAENRRMLEVFRESGFPTRVARDGGDLRVTLTTELSEETLVRYEQRERVAAAAAVLHFLEPDSVAVIGASRTPGSVGAEVLSNILRSSFEGRVFAVNREATRVQGLAAHPSVTELPEAPELAVLAIPAEAVPGVARKCALRGVRALLVLVAGFAETGPEGRLREEELLAICRAVGMRLLGPNCLGAMGAGINATFAPHRPPAGRVGLLSQSGGVGLALIEQAATLGLGLSSFVSIGNRPDLSANDVLEYWEDDPSTEVALLYLESFGNPRNFARIARRLASRKPVIAVHAGRSAAGARAAASHTGAAIGASDVGIEALLAHAGVVRAETLGELFDTGALAAAQPLPLGRRVAIVTNSGGPAILCADTCHAAGLELPELSAGLRTQLAGRLPAHSATGNPVDMLAAAGPSDFEAAIAALDGSGEVDAVIAIFVPALAATADEVDAAVASVARDVALPVLQVQFGALPRARDPSRGPVFSYPESAARALARLVRYVEWREEDRGRLPELEGVRRGEAAGVIAGAAAGQGRWLRPDEVAVVLDCCGLPMVEERRVRGATAAGRAAEELGGRVVLKAFGDGIVHKTELGAVELDLEGEREVGRAARRISRRLGKQGLRASGFIVQRQIDAGVEMLAGISADPLLGPLVACGAGGTAADVLGDVAVRLAPLTDVEASRMIRSLSTFALLDGYRGAPRADVAALEDVLLRLGALADAHPEVAEIDLNPVVVGERGAVILDARVRVEPAQPRAAWPALGAEPPSVLFPERGGEEQRMPAAEARP